MKKKVFFEAYGGNELTCSPEAVFRYLATQCAHEGFTFVWSVNDAAVHADKIAALRRIGDFTVVKRGTASYYRHLYSSAYLVNNMSFGSDFVKRPGQTYLNTWHGVPVKKMGFDVPDRIEDGRNILRNFLAADFLLSTSRAMTRRMYLDAFKLRNVFTGTIVEEGSPRTDRQFDASAARQELRADCPELDLDRDKRKIVLYAPTWRGPDYASAEDPTDLVRSAVSGLERGLDPSKYRVLVKLHQSVLSPGHATAQAEGDHRLERRLVPRGADPNLLLGITDVLVTDYSSIALDFVTTGRPIIHFVPDAASYEKYRDVYDPPERLPGTVVHNAEGLATALDAVCSDDWRPSEQYTASRDRFAPRDDGRVTRRVVDAVFHGHPVRHGLAQPSDGRIKILFYIGPLVRNGITSAAENLLRNIDHDRYDVSALIPFTDAFDERHRNWNRLDPRVRVFFRFGTFTGPIWANFERNLRLESPLFRPGLTSTSQRSIWQREWHRLFGQADFDHVVDFTGYAPFWGTLFQTRPTAKKTVWQHNDLASDADRTVNGATPLQAKLHKVFALYPGFDRIVSVSEDLMAVNRRALATPETTRRFDWLPNTLDRDRIAGAISSADNGGRAGSAYRFVHVGRLSPEKNQLRILRALHRARRTVPSMRLLMIGDGPYRKFLEDDVADLGLSDCVDFTGEVDDPLPLMARSDCMVMASHYEGQPMVILEALAMGVPVLTTPFRSVGGAFPDGGGIVVDDSEEALAQAMADAAANGIPPPEFDADRYNAAVMDRFDTLFDPNADPNANLTPQPRRRSAIPAGPASSAG